LVRACVEAGVRVECLPGPTAFVPALIVSGLPCDRFHFEGFLPHKKGRRKRLDYLAHLPHTFVLYESPNRLLRCLEELQTHCGPERRAAVCRELSKMHEEVARGTLAALLQRFREREKIKGELVIVVAGKDS
ncbi:MAG: 16S rRNA (cytidine(1402)-2'-O)-methyltransferase, partial [Bacteroidetes bacterium]